MQTNHMPDEKHPIFDNDLFSVRNIDIRTDILNNGQRPYFGLDSIDPKWEGVALKPGIALFYDGDAIKKFIVFRPNDYYAEFMECDMNLQTRGRELILPKTDKGKLKKITFSSISAETPSGCVFKLYYGNRQSLAVYCPRNHLTLPISPDLKFKSLRDYQAWKDEYIATCPKDYFEKIERMKITPHRTIKYYNGDIFRFEIDREYYGFGIILGQLKPMRKQKLIPKLHLLDSVMCVPLIVRLFNFRTKNKDISVDELTESPMLPARFLADNGIIWGKYEIIGNKMLEVNDIDFPVQVGYTQSEPRLFRFCWGNGMAITDKVDEVEKILSQTTVAPGSWNLHFFNNVVSIVLEGAPPEMQWQPLSHVIDGQAKKAVYHVFQFPENMTFDDFNTKYGGMTRQEYADYANKSLRPTTTVPG